MITIDITLLLHILNMIALMFILNAVLYKPILGIMEKREAHRRSLQDDAARFEGDAQAQQAELDRRIREAGLKAKKALDDAKAQASAATAKQLAEQRAAADAEKNASLDKVRRETEEARKALEAGTADFAKAMAEKILGRSLNA